MSEKEKRFWLDCVILLLLAMSAIAMLGEVSRQAWAGKADRYPAIAYAAHWQRAGELLQDMTPEQKVGQLLCARNPDNSRDAVENYGLGGVILSSEGLSRWDLQVIAGGFPTSVFVAVENPPANCAVPAFPGPMASLRVVTDVRRSYVQAIRDGADMVVTAEYEAVMGEILRAVACGALPESIVDAAVQRILTVKLQLGMVQ